ncbi:MAG: hypothetical protein IPF68_16445 [Bacteroidales bacterium]|nr:hypothetical protein [Bacteroidales bacterium]
MNLIFPVFVFIRIRAKDKLNIELVNYENTDIEIMGMDGRFIRRISLRSPETQIDLTNLAKGFMHWALK